MSNEGLESGNGVLQTIHASEGGRALKLLQERQKRQLALEQAKTEIETRKRRLGSIDEKYKGSSTEALEEAFKQDTVGLVTVEQFREKRKRLVEKIEATHDAARNATNGVVKTKRKIETKRSKLSFGLDDIEDTEVVETDEKKKYFGKDPSVDTSFLSDADREERIKLEREKLVQDYIKEQERIKEQYFDLTYTYWDGSGHKRAMRVKKGSTIGSFLHECRKVLQKEFQELKTIPTDNLLYVKGDIILPPTLTFYELIKTKARGHAGVLFMLTSSDENDSNCTEKDESFVGKVVQRRWYEKNKHIFPASRWEPYSTGKVYDSTNRNGNIVDI